MTSISSSATRRRGRFFLATGIAASVVLTGCGASDSGGGGGGGQSRNANLTFATGGTGGVYYPYGGGIANLLSSKLPGVVVTVQETNASVDNMKLLDSNQAQMALALGDVVSDAAKGENTFDKPLDICALGNLYNNFVQVFTTKGTGITSIEQVKGKRVSVGAVGSASEVTADRIMEAAGIDPKKDIKRVQLGVAETVQAVEDGTVDVGFWSGGLPTGAVVDLASNAHLVLIPTGQYADALAKKYGDYYFAGDIPAKTYQGQNKAVSNVVSPNILVVRKDMDQSLQKDITKTIFENKKKLITVHPAAKELNPKTAGDIKFIDTCPGAQSYYDSVN